MSIVHRTVHSLSELEGALHEPWDAVVSDAHAEVGTSHVLAVVGRRRPPLPVVLVAPTASEEDAVAALQAGARDFLGHDQLPRLGAVLTRELRRPTADRALFDATSIALLEVALPELDATVEDDPDAVVRQVTAQASVRAVNLAAVEMLEADTAADLMGLLSRCIRPTSEAAWHDLALVLGGSGESVQRQLVLQTCSGRSIDVLLSFGRPAMATARHCVVLSLIDISDRVALERRVRAAQRMEAVGRLAGGIAHDFNNVLTVISSYTGLLVDALHPGDPMREDVVAIREAAQRAEGLTRQLLAFGRCQVAAVRVLDVNGIVSDMDRMLRRLIGEDIELETVTDPDLWLVEIDPTHVEQIVMNLAVNARDAMPDGGVLTVETRNVTLDRSYVARKPADIPCGDYVVLSVTDSGVGMDEQTRSRIFEPFFTTKGAGSGTGLGLATVYGIVKQSDGYVWVYSEPGLGTTIRVYLPRKRGTAVPTELARRDDTAAKLCGSETILVVEDEAPLRRATRRILTKAGYTVLEAENGGAALLLCERHTEPIDAVITDVVMPTMSGHELVQRLSSIRKDIRCLYMSGYTSRTIQRRGKLDDGAVLVEKPFTAQDLLSRLREILDA